MMRLFMWVNVLLFLALAVVWIGSQPPGWLFPNQPRAAAHKRANCVVTEADARSVLAAGRAIGQTDRAMQIVSQMADVCVTEKEALSRYR